MLKEIKWPVGHELSSKKYNGDDLTDTAYFKVKLNLWMYRLRRSDQIPDDLLTF